jgi:hypothetical protein
VSTRAHRRWAREPPPIAQCWQLRFVTRRQFRICQRRSNNIKKWQIRDEDEKKQVKEKKQRLIETLIVEQDILPDSMQELVRRKLTSKGKYTQDLRSFALTPHFYSPKAYRYVRKHWEQLLPHPGTLGKWYKVVDACPGFTKEALDCISLRTADSKPVLANLVFDEMAIREQLIWSEGRFIGGVNLGIQEDESNDSVPLANNAFVLIVVPINQHWKVSIGYFLIRSLNAQQRAKILKKAFFLLNEVNVHIHSITFDGLSSNLAMCTILGANLTY